MDVVLREPQRRDASTDVPVLPPARCTGRITVTTTRRYRNRTRVTHDRSRRRRNGNTYIRGFMPVLLPVGTSHTSFYECDCCARPSCPDFRRAMEFRYFHREVGNHECRSSPSKQRRIRVPSCERTCMRSEVCKLRIWTGNGPERFSHPLCGFRHK